MATRDPWEGIAYTYDQVNARRERARVAALAAKAEELAREVDTEQTM